MGRQKVVSMSDVTEPSVTPESPTSTPTDTTRTDTTTTQMKADLGKRFIAMIIDSAVAAVISLIPFVGGLVAAAYFLVRDGLDYDYLRHRSLGKTLMKLRPVTLDGKAMDVNTSIQRNWMFALGAIGTALLVIPVLGWIAAILLWLVAPLIGLVELILVLKDPEGRRWGDRLANTKVIEVTE